MDIGKMDTALTTIIEGFQQLKKAIKTNDSLSVSPPSPAKNTNENISQKENEFETLKHALYSEKWPEAVNANLICDPDSENDKIERGKGIIELMIEEDLEGLKFLDYGCGEGYCALLASDYKTQISVGFDVKPYPVWKKFQKKNNFLITSNFKEASSKAPFDVIVLFDVFDHVIGDDPVTLLKKVESLLKPEGRVYMRCHPFTSRHATHLYHELNKAYIHLVFSPEEIRKLIPRSKYEEQSLFINYPLKMYNEYIQKTKLKVVSRRDITEKAESFFKIPKISERIMKTTQFNEFPEHQLSLQFVDFVLAK